MLEITLRAALDMRYPRELLRVYLLDDGGTQQKLNQPDAAKAADAHARVQALTRLAERHAASISRASATSKRRRATSTPPSRAPAANWL